tara:strand:+ start:4332 stop:8042 length:3711 start_codon:yes stop_codon:yes gene_type:complete
MSLPRRAIIHIGGKSKTHREQLPQRMLLTKKSNFPSGKPLPTDDHFYFTIDLDDKKNIEVLKNESIDRLLETGQKRPKDLKQVKKINIQIATENEHKLIQKQLDKEKKLEILKRVKEAKNMMKKKQEDKTKRKSMGLSQLLNDCEMDIEYYNNIKIKFKQFEKKYYIQAKDDKHKYNPFRFSLSKDYKTPITFEHNYEGWVKGITEWQNNNKINKKDPLYGEWSQIARDMNRNLLNIETINKDAYFDENIWNSQLMFYFSQLALFTSYFYYEHDKKNVTNKNNMIGGGDFQNNEFYNNYIIETYKKDGSIDEKKFQAFVSNNMKNTKEERKDLCCSIYSQEEFETFVGILFATSDPDNKKYNIIDAVALYTYIYHKHGIKFFYENIFRIDKKKAYQNILKVMTIFDFVDPFLLNDFFDVINKQDKKGKFWDKRLGETYIQYTNDFDEKKTSPWMESEKSKYDIFHNSSNKSMADIISEIKNLAEEKLNKPLEALLKAHENAEKKIDDIPSIITTTHGEPYTQSKNYFSNGDTKIEMMHGLIRQIIMMFYGRGIFLLHNKNPNENLHTMNHYYKSLYKYGVTGFILYIAIHLKNMRTSIHFHDNKYKWPLQIIKGKKAWGSLLDDFLLNNVPDIVKKENNLAYIGMIMCAPKNSPFSVQRLFGENINFPFNVLINPLTTNVKETYNKHFDFFIDHIKNSNGSVKKYEEEWDKIFDKSLILYKNGYLKKERIDTIKKNHNGITIVNNVNDIWGKYKNDNRISFKKNKNHPGELLKKMDKGWLGDVKKDLLRNALDGVYHICYNTFMRDVKNIIKPVIKKNTFTELWPKNSGRPFIFVNKIYMDDDNLRLKKVENFDEKKMEKKLIGIGKPLPNYWFNTKNMFTESSVELNEKLKPFFKKMKDKKDTVTNEDFKEIYGTVIKKIPKPCRISSSESDLSISSIDSEEIEDLTDEMRRIAEEQKREQERQQEEINKLEQDVGKVSDIIAGKDDDEDDEEIPTKLDSDDEKEEEPIESKGTYKEKQKEIRKILKNTYQAEPIFVPDNGDCLFQALSNGLKKGGKEESHEKIRQDIVNHVMDKWTDYEPYIIIEQDDGTKMYETKEDYENQMGQKWKTDNNIQQKPRAHFGGDVEIQAFLKLYPDYKIQILKYEHPNMVELPPFKKENIGKEKDKIITLFLYDLHYQNLKKIEQSGGSNNVYINKCKNHRHNRTKKFRMKLKDIDNWVYLEPRKKKKHTRKKY